MRKFFTSLCMLMLCCALTYAQTRSVTGKVTDAQGKPVPYATVTVKGTKTAVSADENGNFSIEAAPNSILVFSASGFQPYEVSVKSKSSISATMSSQEAMNEVIVTAGGIKAKRKEIGTANTVIKSDVLTEGKAVNVAGGLQGKVAGMQINATSGGVNPNFRIVLRGQRSLTGNNQALLVVDNVIVPNEVLANINPEDIDNVVVLNGSGAAALYGSQASNGAMIVTTKKGKRGAVSITASQTTTVEEVAFFPKIQKLFGSGGSGYGTDIYGNPNYSAIENQSYGPAFDGKTRPIGVRLEDGSQDSAIYQYNPGHFKFWNKGITNQSDVALSSGDDNSTFYMSGQYAGTAGTTPGDKYNRTSFRINGTRKVGNSVNVTYTTGYIQNRYDITSQTASMYANMLNMPSNVDITKYKNWKTDKFANPNGYYNPWYQNPYFTADNYRKYERNDILTGSLELKFTPVNGLDLIARQGITTKNNSITNTVGGFIFTDYAKKSSASSKSDIAAFVQQGSSFKTQLLSDLYAQYNKKLNDFNFTLIGGGQWTQNQTKVLSATANGLVVPDLFTLRNGLGTPGVFDSKFMTRQIGTYGDLRIGYKNVVFLHGTGRNDWVSNLAPENRSFFYPSVDLSFIASDAIPMLKESSLISYLKVRGGWSKVGQVNLGTVDDYGAYYLQQTYNGSLQGFPYGNLAGYSVGNILISPSLKPEITKGYEYGFDLNLLNDRFISSFTFFNTKTSNQTVETNVSSSTGFAALRTNTGQTSSKGIEYTAHATIVKSKNLSVTVGGNYAYLDNKVIFIDANLPRLALTTFGTDGPGSYAVGGQVFPVIMGFDYNRDPQGHVIVDQSTGLPTKSDTISILGNAVPKHKIGLDGSIKYKNFSFTILFEYRGGYQIYNDMGRELDWSGTGYRTAVYNRQRFVYPNSVYIDGNGKYVTNTNIEIKNGNGNNGFWTDGINRDVTSNYVTSGDFWKLREVSISYDIPAVIINRTKFIKGIRLSVQGRNLLMWMAKDNYYTDPEYSSAGNSNGVGLTTFDAPPSRYYGGTISVKF